MLKDVVAIKTLKGIDWKLQVFFFPLIKFDASKTGAYRYNQIAKDASTKNKSANYKIFSQHVCSVNETNRVTDKSKNVVNRQYMKDSH